MREPVIPAGKRVSSAMDGNLKPHPIEHGLTSWSTAPAIHAGMTILEKIDHAICQSRIKECDLSLYFHFLG